MGLFCRSLGDSTLQFEVSVELIIVDASDYSSEENQRIFVFEDTAWSMKGQYKYALEENEAAKWINHEGQQVLPIIAVSKTAFDVYLT